MGFGREGVPREWPWWCALLVRADIDDPPDFAIGGRARELLTCDVLFKCFQITLDLVFRVHLPQSADVGKSPKEQMSLDVWYWGFISILRPPSCSYDATCMRHKARLWELCYLVKQNCASGFRHNRQGYAGEF